MRSVRIYQITPANQEYSFMDYAFIKSKGIVPHPPELYKLVYDGQPGTEELEDIFRIFNLEHPEGYTGRSLSVSDIVELYDDTGSSFFFCDTLGFLEIQFTPAKTE